MNDSDFVMLVGGKSGSFTSLDSYLGIRDELLSSPSDLNRLTSIYYISEEGKIYLHDNQYLPETKKDLVNGTSIKWVEFIGRLIESDDYIFSVLHGKEGTGGYYQGMSQILNLRGNFGSVFPMCIARSKWALSFIAPRLSQGLVHCPDTWVLSSNPSESEMNSVLKDLDRRPAIIKPNSLGYSRFVELFDSLSLNQLRSHIEIIRPHDNEILVQEYIKGVDYSCGVLENNGKIQTLPVAEIQIESEFYGHREKKNNLERILFRYDNTEVFEQIKLASLKLFTVLGIRNTCRFDYIYSNGKLYFLEANAIPGLGRDGIFPKMLKEIKLSRIDLINICISNYNYQD